MNRSNAALYLPLVQALADGKTLQYRYNGKWNSTHVDSEFKWSLSPSRYRVKPEPVVVPVWKFYKDGELTRIMMRSSRDNHASLRNAGWVASEVIDNEGAP